MIVEVYCASCTDFEEALDHTGMEPEGDLFTDEEKTQTQMYKCLGCGISVQVSINTLLDKK